jgi:hypothetical protein
MGSSFRLARTGTVRFGLLFLDSRTRVRLTNSRYIEKVAAAGTDYDFTAQRGNSSGHAPANNTYWLT